MRNRFIFLLTVFSFLIFLGTSQAYADLLVDDSAAINGVTNPDYFEPDDPGTELAWLENLLGYEVGTSGLQYLGKDEADAGGFDGFFEGDWTEYGVGITAPVVWEYAVLKYGNGLFEIWNHLAISDEDSDMIVDLPITFTDEEGTWTITSAGLSHITYFGSTSVPEPHTMLLLGTGLIGLAAFGRKRFRK